MKLSLLYNAIYVSILLAFVRKIIGMYRDSFDECGIDVPHGFHGYALCLGFRISMTESPIMVPIKIVPTDNYNLAKLDDILLASGISLDFKKKTGCHLIDRNDDRCDGFRINAVPIVTNAELREMTRIVLSNLELVKE